MSAACADLPDCLKALYVQKLATLDDFKVEGKDWPDEEDEEAFHAYLTTTYGIAKKEFY